MEMQQVRYFLALSQCLNFTRAAEMANVSQPSLTRAIQQLEAELGGPLFHRERQRTHLSELGLMMLPYLRQIQEQTEAARAKAKAVRRLEQTRVNIGAMCTISPAIFSELMMEFRERHPGVALCVTTRKVFGSDRDDWVQGMIKAGMGFGFFPEFSVTDPALVTRRLIDPEFVRTIVLLTVRGRPHSPAIGALVKEARSFRWPKSSDDSFTMDTSTPVAHELQS